MKKFLAVLALMFVVVARIHAQTLTPYETQWFSVTFNGAVSSDLNVRNTTTSYDNQYTSNNVVISERVTVRFVDHDIPNGYTSTEFYVDNSVSWYAANRNGSVVARSQTSYDGHPVSYVSIKFTDGTNTYMSRCRYILVNAREVIFVQTITLFDDANQAEWERFEASLTIK